jgi:NADP-dependent 3-hydroxy acid dehydrogenase YdfG
MDLGLAGKVVIVTGATANIGRAIGLDFAAEAARVVIVGRDADAGARVAADSKARGAQDAVFVAADLLDPAAPATIMKAAENLGPVEVLVNNVGGNVGTGFFVDSDPASWDGDIDLNFKSNLRMTQAVLPGMIGRKAGRIVNIGSTAGIVGDYQLPIYSAMKAAVHGFTVVLAKEVAHHCQCRRPLRHLCHRPCRLQHRQPLPPRQRLSRPLVGRPHRVRPENAPPPRAWPARIRQARGDRRGSAVPRLGPGGIRHRAGAQRQRRSTAVSERWIVTAGNAATDCSFLGRRVHAQQSEAWSSDAVRRRGYRRSRPSPTGVDSGTAWKRSGLRFAPRPQPTWPAAELTCARLDRTPGPTRG